LRGWLAALPVVVAFLCSYDELENDTTTWAIGGALFLAAMAVRIWAQCHLHYRLSGHKVLTVTGPYRYSRNPIYLANTAMIAALVWLMEVPWLVVPTVIWCALVYSVVVRYEESRLSANFGERYRCYMQTVPQWFGWRAVEGAEGIPGRCRLGLAVGAEVHCLLFLLLPAFKEMVS
ncbi:MAG: isoprenylcysteine carboxylmethyltransferase family protein, partial [Planctomycetota bacterium]|nr:isoprenylcysteine carboxylmethyltransferase family protein [Planctomycetota bacterium]